MEVGERDVEDEGGGDSLAAHDSGRAWVGYVGKGVQVEEHSRKTRATSGGGAGGP